MEIRLISYSMSQIHFCNGTNGLKDPSIIDIHFQLIIICNVSLEMMFPCTNYQGVLLLVHYWIIFFLELHISLHQIFYYQLVVNVLT
jgi:hypothetical protein